MSADTGERYGHDLQDEARTVQRPSGTPEHLDGHLSAVAQGHELDVGRGPVNLAVCHEAFQRLWPPPGP